jgi:ATP-dependent protease ClpP protease subunit
MPLRAAPVWALLGPGKERPKDWGVRVDVENLTTAGLTKMYIYGEIGYWGVESMDVVTALRDISGPVEVHINSMGGSVWEGLAIYQALVEHPHDVTVVIDGLAASAASFIAMAGKTIEIGPAAHMMIHNAAAFCSGDADAFEAQATMLRNCTAAIAGLYAKRSGKDADEFVAAMAAETWYIGQEAVNAGLADAVRGEEIEPEFPENAARAVAFNLAKLPDPPVMKQAPAPKKVNTVTVKVVKAGDELPAGTLAKAMGVDPKNSSPSEVSALALGIWDHLDTPTGLFAHLTEGAAQ